MPLKIVFSAAVFKRITFENCFPKYNNITNWPHKERKYFQL